MNIFEMLTDEAQSVARRFKRVVAHYPAIADWTWDHTFDETKDDIDKLTDYLQTESALESKIIQCQDMSDEMDKAATQRQAITASIDNVLMIHVDEAGFKEGLKKIADRLDEHRTFCTQCYYPLLEQHMSNDQLQSIEDQLKFSLPSLH